MNGMILFAHGARDPRWAHPFERTAQLIRDQAPGLKVLNAYLEFMSPDLNAAGRQLADAGCRRIDVVPLFLGAGGHVRKDLPERLQVLRSERPDVEWRLNAAVGEHPELLAAMARIAVDLSRQAPEPSL